MSPENCVWGDLFDDEEKSSWEDGFFISGILSVSIGVWLNLSIIMTNLRLDRSYRNLSNFTLTAGARRAVALIPFFGKLGGFQPHCNIFAFLETFLAVFEVEWLTHVCIERYDVAKYVTNVLLSYSCEYSVLADWVDSKHTAIYLLFWKRFWQCSKSSGLLTLGGFQPHCNIFAFLETFLAVFEVEWLTHVCIERYVVAKYVTNGWHINKNHYALFKSLCVFFATLYSFLPLFGIGRYGSDFSCTFCTFDMILPDSWQRYFIVAIFFLRSIKPSAVMITMLIWACVLEGKMKVTDENNMRQNFTRNIVIITIVNLVCWTPIALIRGCVVLSQLLYSPPQVTTSAFYIKWAMWIHWMAPALTAVALLLVDDKIQNKMLLKPNCDINETQIDALPEKKDK